MSQQLGSVQQSLIQSERLISMGKLAAGVAHEINNPLTGILSYAEDLMEETDPSDPRYEDYEVIVHEALRCRQIVRGLLDFARQDSPQLNRIHPRELIDNAMAVVVRQAVFQNIRIEVDADENTPTLEVDPVQIEQVLVNLLINAQQAMPNGGRILVRTRGVDGGERVEFCIKDEGTGIPPEIRSRVFEPFFSTKDGKTDGLGLAVCLGIVQQHGGSIEIESETEKGTTFRIVLPTARRTKKG
jgi:two-component system NtrC family sensor kinase